MNIRLSGIEKRTIALNSLYNFGAALVSLFVSVYIYVYTESIPAMCLRTIVWMAMIPVFYPAAYRFSLKHSVSSTFTIGLSLITASLVYTLFAGELFGEHPVLIMLQAIVFGAGDAFYWYSSYTCIQTVTTGKNRNVFLSYNGFACNIAAIAAPVFSTALLSASGNELAGYRAILGSIIAVYVIVILIAFSINIHTEDREDRLKDVAKLCSTDNRIRKLYASFFAYGLVNGLGLCLLSLLIFRAAGSGNAYSRMQVLFYLITISGFYLVKYLFAKGRLEATFKTGAILRVGAVTLLVIMPNLAGAVIHGIMFAASNVFFDNSISYIAGNVIDSYPGRKSALIAARESMLAFGRIVSMVIVLLFYLSVPGEAYLTIAPVILSLAAVVTERMMLSFRI